MTPEILGLSYMLLSVVVVPDDQVLDDVVLILCESVFDCLQMRWAGGQTGAELL